MNRLIANRFVLLSALTLVGACSGDYAGDTPEPDASVAEVAAAAAEAGAGRHALGDPWMTTASNGSQVTVETDDAVAPGVPFVLKISVRDPADLARALSATSVDVVSPAMPMHGLVRIPVTEGEARIQIPMDGAWALYVNLDDTGAASAEFLFEVSAGDAGGQVRHGAE
jgi:hypothetical protein